METKLVDKENAEALLSLQEGPYLDLKARAIKPSKLSETVSAFANSSGGEIWVGIAEGDRDNRDIRAWDGFPSLEDANPILQVLQDLTALGQDVVAEFVGAEEYEGYLLHLIVQKTRSIVRATDGTPYIRVGSQKIAVNSLEQIKRLELDKGIVSFEDEIIPVDKEIVSNSLVVINFILGVVPTAEPKDWLAKQNLLHKSQPTVAGVLLFADEPQAYLAKRSAIKLYRYGTSDDEGARDAMIGDPQTIEGCAYDLIMEAVRRTKELIEGINRLGDEGLEPIEYPDETLHEIITNAVLHRDYSIASDVHIRVFDNRIEIQSPGRLPGHVTIENILNEQSARNPKLVRIINKFPNPPNKDVGEGLNTAFSAMHQLKLKPPVITERENSVIVNIKHERLASAPEAVMQYLTHHEEITNSIGRELTGIRSENSMKDVFIALKKRGMIEPVPEKRGNKSAWRRVDEGKDT
jgi:ATP-dependent DNA helicase RecG